MCKYVYRHLDDEGKAFFFKEYLTIREMYQNFLDDVSKTIINLDPKTIREKHEIIIEIAKAYAQAVKYLQEIDELIFTTFLD